MPSKCPIGNFTRLARFTAQAKRAICPAAGGSSQCGTGTRCGHVCPTRCSSRGSSRTIARASTSIRFWSGNTNLPALPTRRLNCMSVPAC